MIFGYFRCGLFATTPGSGLASVSLFRDRFHTTSKAAALGLTSPEVMPSGLTKLLSEWPTAGSHPSSSALITFSSDLLCSALIFIPQVRVFYILQEFI